MTTLSAGATGIPVMIRDLSASELPHFGPNQIDSQPERHGADHQQRDEDEMLSEVSHGAIAVFDGENTQHQIPESAAKHHRDDELRHLDACATRQQDENL